MKAAAGMRQSFYIMGNCFAFSYDTKASGRMRTDARGILLLRNMHPARKKCASGREIKVARMCKAHFFIRDGLDFLRNGYII